MLLFLLSLAILFLASLVGYVAIRAQQKDWPPTDIPPLPLGFWIATLVLLISSFTIHRANNNAQADRLKAVRGWMLATSLLGAAFMLLQISNWFVLTARGMPMSLNIYAVLFYTLTGLHALHVLGGLIPLAMFTARSFNEPPPPRLRQGVRFCAMYWHFLDGVWLVLVATLFFRP